MGLFSCQNTWFVINKHWQRSKGSSGCGVEDAEMWLGTDQTMARTKEEDCKMGLGELNYQNADHLLLQILVQDCCAVGQAQSKQSKKQEEKTFASDLDKP